MSKIKKIILMTLMVFCFSVVLTSCTQNKKESIVITNESEYNEAEFASEVAAEKAGNVVFAKNGVCDFTILYPDEIDSIIEKDGKISSYERTKIELKESAVFFANAIKSVVGDEVDVMPISAKSDGSNIILMLNENSENINDQGYFLSIKNAEITISGKTYKGITNGMFSFLEEYLGCMFLAEDYDYFPNLPTVNFNAEEKFFNPSFSWRAVNSYPTARKKPIFGDGTEYLGWNNKLKLNDTGDWGTWCHTFYSFIPPKEYFATHPEYFSEYNGKRKHTNGPSSGQLCLTNEDVYSIISTKLFAAMEANPGLRYWDVSQMDTWINNGTGCRCKNCKALDDEQDSSMGSLLTFINRLAEECAEKFPDNFISTLAYNYSVVPPKTIVPRDNVIIKLCLMPGDNASSYANPTSNAAKKANKVVSEWSKIAKNILIWDYNIDFHQYLMPYPIFTPMNENNDFYLDNNVYGVFHQIGFDKGGDTDELNAYVFAKLMWDRNTNVEKTMAKYLKVYYGSSSADIANYYNTINKNLIKANKNLYLYSPIIAHSFDYLSVKNINNYLSIFEKAEANANGDEILLKRIRRAKVGVLYSKAAQFSFDKKGRRVALEELMVICEENGIHSLLEGAKVKDINELQKFYNRKSSEINGIPWIIASIVVVVVSVISLVVTLVIVKAKKKKGIALKV